MVERVRVTAYHVSHCGFYRRGAAQPEFGGLGEIVEALGDWIRQRPIGETSTYAPREGVEDDTRLLCSGIAERDGDYLFEMWEPTSGAEGALASLAADGRVGDAAAEDIRVRRGQIPGVARLFWLMPLDRLLCTVQIRQRAAAKSAFHRYVKDFVRWRTPWSVVREDEDTYEYLGYALRPDEPPQKLIARFVLGRTVDARRVSDIRRRRLEIRAVEYRAREQVGRARQTLRGVDNMLDRITRMHVSVAEPTSFRLRISLPYTPERAELDGLLEEAEGDDESGPELGFRMPEGIVWVNARHQSEVESLEVRRRTAAQVHLRDLLSRLQSRLRGRLVSAASGEEE